MLVNDIFNVNSSDDSFRKDFLPSILDKQYKINEIIANTSKDVDKQETFNQQESGRKTFLLI